LGSELWHLSSVLCPLTSDLWPLLSVLIAVSYPLWAFFLTFSPSHPLTFFLLSSDLCPLTSDLCLLTSDTWNLTPETWHLNWPLDSRFWVQRSEVLGSELWHLILFLLSFWCLLCPTVFLYLVTIKYFYFLNLLLSPNRPTRPPPNSQAATCSESDLNSAYELESSASDAATPTTASSSRNHPSFGLLGGSHWLLSGTKTRIVSAKAINNFLPFIPPPLLVFWW